MEISVAETLDIAFQKCYDTPRNEVRNEHHAYEYLIFNLLMIQFTTGVMFLLSSMYGPTGVAPDATSAAVVNTGSQNEISREIVLQDRKSVEKYLRKEYADTPILLEIARCESTFTQFDKNGEVIRGRVNNKDVGVMQINEKYHLDTAKKLGIDLHTIEGNVEYAKYLYAKEGAKPWSASAPCWSKA